MVEYIRFDVDTGLHAWYVSRVDTDTQKLITSYVTTRLPIALSRAIAHVREELEHFCDSDEEAEVFAFSVLVASVHIFAYASDMRVRRANPKMGPLIDCAVKLLKQPVDEAFARKDARTGKTNKASKRDVETDSHTGDVFAAIFQHMRDAGKLGVN